MQSREKAPEDKEKLQWERGFEIVARWWVFTQRKKNSYHRKSLKDLLREKLPWAPFFSW